MNNQTVFPQSQNRATATADTTWQLNKASLKNRQIATFNRWPLFLFALILVSCASFRPEPETEMTRVGMAQHRFVDWERGRQLKTKIWYPIEPQAAEEVGANKVYHGIFAAQNGEPALSENEKAPLYILVHGTMGTWRNLSWLATDLAEKGGIVAAANHPGSTWITARPKTVLKTWNQPQDVSFLIDSLLDSEYGPYIDEENIVVIGFSLGGYTSMALSGARIDMEQMISFCESHPDEGCSYFEPVFDSLDDEFYTKAGRDFRDSRIKAAVALSPGLFESVEERSFAEIDIPLLIIGAEHDQNVPPQTHYYPTLDQLPASARYHELEQATHFSFVQLCKPGALEILAKNDEEFVCVESGERSRLEIHAEVIALIDQFLAD